MKPVRNEARTVAEIAAEHAAYRDMYRPHRESAYRPMPPASRETSGHGSHNIGPPASDTALPEHMRTDRPKLGRARLKWPTRIDTATDLPRLAGTGEYENKGIIRSY